MRRKFLVFLLVCLTMTIALVGCAGKEEDAGTSDNVTKELTPTLIPTEEPVATPETTATPEPTATPTSTPMPTPTDRPTPSPGPVPEISGEVGDTILFGAYEQDNDLTNGQEPIEWLILSKDDSRMLVISKYVLDSMEFSSNSMVNTWEKCSVRAWLNNEFYNYSFHEGEKSLINETLLINEVGPNSGANGGNDTEDKIFLLSLRELEYLVNYKNEIDIDSLGLEDSIMYELTDKPMQHLNCAATAYAISKGLNTSKDWFEDESKYKYYEDTPELLLSDDGEYSCQWWTRTPGYNSNVIFITWDSCASENGKGVTSVLGVRPAMYIKLQ